MLKGNKKEIDRMFDHFDNVKPNKSQKEAVYGKGFYYYLSIENMTK